MVRVNILLCQIYDSRVVLALKIIPLSVALSPQAGSLTWLFKCLAFLDACSTTAISANKESPVSNALEGALALPKKLSTGLSGLCVCG